MKYHTIREKNISRPVYHSVIRCLIKGIIKSEFLILEVLCEVNFLFWFMYDNVLSARNSHNIYISSVGFCKLQNWYIHLYKIERIWEAKLA